MSLADWLKRLFRGKVRASRPDLGLVMPGWRVVEQGQEMTLWQDIDGDALSLALDATFGFPELSDVNAVRPGSVRSRICWSR